MTPDLSGRCPLCGLAQADVVETLSYDDIWAALRSQYHADFSPSVIARHTTAAGITTLHECANCGLQFFSPVVAGDSEFYSELAKSGPAFAEDRWEFAHARRMISATDAVVDFGCGEGSFLRSLSDVHPRRVGVDHFAVVRNLEAHGIEGYVSEFSEFAETQRGMFDVACAFHVIEHLPAVDNLIGAAITCLRPGGRLLISVPNRERVVMDVSRVLDCPPHHVSRWQSAQLLEMANLFGLRLLCTRLERRTMPTLGRTARQSAALARKAAGRLALGRASSQPSPPPSVLGTRALSLLRLARRLTLGQSMLAEFATADARPKP